MISKGPVSLVADRRTWVSAPAVGQVSRTPPAIAVATSAAGGPRRAEPLKGTHRICSTVLPAASMAVNRRSYEPTRLDVVQRPPQTMPSGWPRVEPLPVEGIGSGAGRSSQLELPLGAKARAIDTMPLSEPAATRTGVL